MATNFTKSAISLWKECRRDYSKLMKKSYFAKNPDLDFTVREGAPKPRQNTAPKEKLGRSATFAAASKAKDAAGGDADSLLLAATQAAKSFDMNKHFILKKMRNDPDLVEKLVQFVQTEMG